MSAVAKRAAHAAEVPADVARLARSLGESWRACVVANIVNQLRRTPSSPGVVAWFGWPRADLGGATRYRGARAHAALKAFERGEEFRFAEPSAASG